MKPVRLGIVGAGGIAQTHVLAASRMPELEVSAVVDTDVRVAQAMAEPFSAMTSTEITDLINAVDLVVLSTPPAHHVELACTLLEAGIAVLCEKPLALTRDQAQHMTNVAHSTGSLLTMASKYRFATDVVRAKGMLASETIGKVLRLENAFAARVDMTNRWNANRAVSGGGVIMDNGTHSLEICRFLLGPLAEVLAVQVPQVQGVEVEDSALMLVRSVSGVLASIELSWSTDRVTDRYLALVGQQGTIDVGWKGSRFTTTSSPAPVEFGMGWDKVQALGSNLANVVKAMRGEEELVVGPEEAMASVAAVDAAYASLSSGVWEPVRT